MISGTRYFNTAGACDPRLHYMVPPGPRLPELRQLIERGMYLVLHAPRQTGKTTILRALAKELTAEGRLAALHFSCQPGQAVGDDYGRAEELILFAMREDSLDLPAELRPPNPWPDAPAGARLTAGLGAWARACPRPLVLFFDEIDALRDASLISVLGQLRAGYDKRPDAFPASVVLCGLRDVRDYKAASGGDASRLGSASPFNIKVKSLRLSDFTETDVKALYAQHTAETGQGFAEEALARAWDYTQGQPWLANALAREIVEELKVTGTVTAAEVDWAKERLILARATHLDSLLGRLYEPRVRRVLEPIIAGETLVADTTLDQDLAYVRDLGLVAPGLPPRIANPIYQEVIFRVLGTVYEANVETPPRSFVTADGRLDWDRLLREFAEFWREHGDVLTHAQSYNEAAPHLVFMGYLHRLVNGGGFVSRESGVGRGRIDLLVRWPYTDAEGRPAAQREAVELKVWHPNGKNPLPAALNQLDRYLTRLSLDHGTLIIFDRRPTAEDIDERTRFEDAVTPTGRPVTLLRA